MARAPLPFSNLRWKTRPHFLRLPGGREAQHCLRECKS